MKAPQQIREDGVTVYKWAYVKAAILANKSPLMDKEAAAFAIDLKREANKPENRRTGAFAASWRVADAPRDMSSDRFVYTIDPGATPINYGTTRQRGKKVFEAVIRAAIVSGKRYT